MSGSMLEDSVSCIIDTRRDGNVLQANYGGSMELGGPGLDGKNYEQSELLDSGMVVIEPITNHSVASLAKVRIGIVQNCFVERPSLKE